jgi:RNA polymerase sigma factor (sigma-70 family)
MPLVRGQAKDRFEAFAADAMDTPVPHRCLLTGDAGDAEDLVQETFLRVAKRWNRVESMNHPVAYARRILVNLVLDGAERRTRQRAELEPSAAEPADESALRALLQVDDLAEFRWAVAQLPPRQRGAGAALLGGPARGRGRGHPGLLPGDGQEHGVPAASRLAWVLACSRPASAASARTEGAP